MFLCYGRIVLDAALWIVVDYCPQWFHKTMDFHMPLSNTEQERSRDSTTVLLLSRIAQAKLFYYSLVRGIGFHILIESLSTSPHQTFNVLQSQNSRLCRTKHNASRFQSFSAVLFSTYNVLFSSLQSSPSPYLQRETRPSIIPNSWIGIRCSR